MDRKEELFMARNIVKEIRRATRRKFNAEEKIRIVLEGLRGEVPVSLTGFLLRDVMGTTTSTARIAQSPGERSILNQENRGQVPPNIQKPRS